MKKLLTLFLVGLALGPHLKARGQQLDQSNVINTSGGFGSQGINSWNQLSQTFTAASSGRLTRIDLQLVTLGDLAQLTNGLSFTLSRLSSLNSPAGVPLATASFQSADVPHLDAAGYASSYLMPITFSTPPVLNAGDYFSLTLTSAQPWSAGGQYEWILTPSDSIDRYSRGAAWNNLNDTGWMKESYQVDFGFRTFVAPVPEPATLSLLGCAGVAWLWQARRRRD
jgi:hypothetical protein